MRKRIFALLLCAIMLLCMMPSAFAETERVTRFLEINETNFPDADFRTWIIDHLNHNGDAQSGYYMTEAQVLGVTTISMQSDNVQITGPKGLSLDGIELFPALNELYLDHYKLESFQFSGMHNLKKVVFTEVKTTLADFSGCSALESIQWDNGFDMSLPWFANEYMIVDKIDCSGCPNLLSVKATNVQCADVGNCPKLEVLSLEDGDYNGHLGEAYGCAEHVTDCTALRLLCCKGAGAFDLSGLSNLEVLVIDGPITSLNLSGDDNLRGLAIGGYMNKYAYFTDGEIQLETSSSNEYRRDGSLNLDLSEAAALEILVLDSYILKSADLSGCRNLKTLKGTKACNIKELDLSGCINLETLDYLHEWWYAPKTLEKLTMPDSTALTRVDVSGNRIRTLDLSKNTSLETLNASNNELRSLKLPASTSLTTVQVWNNHLGYLDVSRNPNLEEIGGSGQTLFSNRGPETDADGNCRFDLKAFSGANPAALMNVRETYGYYTDLESLLYKQEESDDYTGAWPQSYERRLSYDKTTGLVTSESHFYNIRYKRGPLEITVWMPFEDEIDVRWSGSYGQYNNYMDSVSLNGSTPYMVYQGDRRLEPRYLVVGTDAQESRYIVLDPVSYNATFQNNDVPGTATLNIKTNGTGKTASNWFKIYLPATKTTKISNVKNGIKLKWDAVPKAKGYVIYRRAWSTTTGGWTEFKRWNNTTNTTWTDTTVYAGTRYQYGVKAYFSDPMDNYNLGLVGPLKTTARITTRTLTGVEAGSKQLTARWDGSKTVTGYQVRIATDQGFTQNVKTVKVTQPDIYRTTIRSLKSGTTYYVQVRGYQTFDGMTYYGEWSNTLNCKVR